MTEPRRFIVSTVFAWSLTISVGVMTVVGVMAAFLPAGVIDQPALRIACVLSFAALAGLALGNANCAAAAAQHAVSRNAPFWTAVAPALLNAAIFCGASVVGVHLGWEMMRLNVHGDIQLPDTSVIDLCAFLVAFAKVAQAWVVETRKSLDQAAIEAAEAADREERKSTNAAMRRAEPPLRQPWAPEVVEGGRTSARIATGAAAVSVGLAGALTDQPAQAASFQAPALPLIEHSAQTWPSPEVHAEHLLKAGASQRSAAKVTGLTRYKIGLIAAEVAA